MAERVPIWYAVHGVESSSVEAYGNLQKTAAHLHRELNLSVAIACAVDDDEQIECIASSGPAAPPLGTVADPNRGICGRCVRQNRLQIANDIAAEPITSQQLCERLGIRSILTIPLGRRSRCVGFFAAFSDVPDRFDLALIERIRREAKSVEEQVGLKTSQRLSFLSGRALRKTAELRINAIEATSEDSEAHSLPESRHQFAEVLAEPLRPVLIAGLIVCGLSIAFLFPSVNRSKNSRTASQQIAATRDHEFQASSAIRKDFADYQAIIEDPNLRDLRHQAESGNVPAQASLAARYEKGEGVPRDRIKACAWYIIAGANGDLGAKQRAVLLSHGLAQYQIAQIRFNVGKMYMEGIGAPRDPVVAYSWFALAQAAGDIRARVEQEKLESVMSADQVSAALRRASAWLLAQRLRGNQDSRVLASAWSQLH